MLFNPNPTKSAQEVTFLRKKRTFHPNIFFTANDILVERVS